MGNPAITPITMPKWGLSMQEGKVVEWVVPVGVVVALGDPLLDIETEKIANTFEALDIGLLRRQVAKSDDVLPVGALLGVLAPESVSEADIDAYITEFQANYVPPAAEAEDAGPRYLWAEVGNLRLRYTKVGDSGPAVILIHGFGGDLGNWLFNQEPLAANAQVYALDLPGHGQSTKAITDGAVAALATVVAGFMAEIGIERAHLVGHSLGGAISLQLAMTEPTRVLSLNLLAPAAVANEINGGYLSGFVNGESRRDMKPILQQLVANPDLITRQLVDDILQFKRTDGVPEALRAIAAGFANGDQQKINLRDKFATLPIPVQVIWGKLDKIVPVSQASDLPANVIVHLLDGVGHLAHMEAAAQVNAILRSVILA